MLEDQGFETGMSLLYLKESIKFQSNLNFSPSMSSSESPPRLPSLFLSMLRVSWTEEREESRGGETIPSRMSPSGLSSPFL